LEAKTWRPVPIKPTVMRLEGAFLPKTDDGTMDGIPMLAVVNAVFFKKSRRFIIL
jgi:hypothetical protein